MCEVFVFGKLSTNISVWKPTELKGLNLQHKPRKVLTTRNKLILQDIKGFVYHWPDPDDANREDADHFHKVPAVQIVFNVTKSRHFKALTNDLSGLSDERKDEEGDRENNEDSSSEEEEENGEEQSSVQSVVSSVADRDEVVAAGGGEERKEVERKVEVRGLDSEDEDEEEREREREGQTSDTASFVESGPRMITIVSSQNDVYIVPNHLLWKSSRSVGESDLPVLIPKETFIDEQTTGGKLRVVKQCVPGLTHIGALVHVEAEKSLRSLLTSDEVHLADLVGCVPGHPPFYCHRVVMNTRLGSFRWDLLPHIFKVRSEYETTPFQLEREERRRERRGGGNVSYAADEGEEDDDEEQEEQEEEEEEEVLPLDVSDGELELDEIVLGVGQRNNSEVFSRGVAAEAVDSEEEEEEEDDGEEEEAEETKGRGLLMELLEEKEERERLDIIEGINSVPSPLSSSPYVWLVPSSCKGIQTERGLHSKYGPVLFSFVTRMSRQDFAQILHLLIKWAYTGQMSTTTLQTAVLLLRFAIQYNVKRLINTLVRMLKPKYPFILSSLSIKSSEHLLTVIEGRETEIVLLRPSLVDHGPSHVLLGGDLGAAILHGRRLNHFGADVMFVVEGESVWAHRCILAVRSSYFLGMFRARSLLEGRAVGFVRIELPGCSLSAFKLCLRWIYTGSILETPQPSSSALSDALREENDTEESRRKRVLELSVWELASVVILADRLMLSGLKRRAEIWLHDRMKIPLSHSQSDSSHAVTVSGSEDDQSTPQAGNLYQWLLFAKKYNADRLRELILDTVTAEEREALLLQDRVESNSSASTVFRRKSMSRSRQRSTSNGPRLPRGGGGSSDLSYSSGPGEAGGGGERERLTRWDEDTIEAVVNDACAKSADSRNVSTHSPEYFVVSKKDFSKMQRPYWIVVLLNLLRTVLFIICTFLVYDKLSGSHSLSWFEISIFAFLASLFSVGMLVAHLNHRKKHCLGWWRQRQYKKKKKLLKRNFLLLQNLLDMISVVLSEQSSAVPNVSIALSPPSTDAEDGVVEEDRGVEDRHVEEEKVDIVVVPNSQVRGREEEEGEEEDDEEEEEEEEDVPANRIAAIGVDTHPIPLRLSSSRIPLNVMSSGAASSPAISSLPSSSLVHMDATLQEELNADRKRREALQRKLKAEQARVDDELERVKQLQKSAPGAMSAREDADELLTVKSRLLSSLALMAFSLMLGLKLDGETSLSWRTVFLPILIFDVLAGLVLCHYAFAYLRRAFHAVNVNHRNVAVRLFYYFALLLNTVLQMVFCPAGIFILQSVLLAARASEWHSPSTSWLITLMPLYVSSGGVVAILGLVDYAALMVGIASLFSASVRREVKQIILQLHGPNPNLIPAIVGIVLAHIFFAPLFAGSLILAYHLQGIREYSVKSYMVPFLFTEFVVLLIIAYIHRLRDYAWGRFYHVWRIH